MAQKRKNGNEADDMTSREKKKLKLSVARTIATQAGPSQITSRTIPTNSAFIKISTTLKEAPSGIRYGRYAQCHRYREIRRSECKCITTKLYLKIHLGGRHAHSKSMQCIKL